MRGTRSLRDPSIGGGAAAGVGRRELSRFGQEVSYRVSVATQHIMLGVTCLVKNRPIPAPNTVVPAFERKTMLAVGIASGQRLVIGIAQTDAGRRTAGRVSPRNIQCGNRRRR